jgi:hypothetical protein
VPFCSNNNWQTSSSISMRATCCRSLRLRAAFMADRSKYCQWMTQTYKHTLYIYSIREQLSRIWKSTHLESYNCRHIRDDRDTAGTQSHYSLLYRIAHAFVWTQSYRVL